MNQRHSDYDISEISKRVSTTIILGLIVLLLTSGLVSADGEAEVTVEQNTTNGSTSTYDITVQNASNGINGLEFNVSLANADDGDIIDASLRYEPAYAEEYSTSNAGVADDQNSATFAAFYVTNPIIAENKTTIASIKIEQSDTVPVELDTNIDDGTDPESGIGSIDGKYSLTRVPWHNTYTDNNAVVQDSGLNTAVSDYLQGDLQPAYLNSVISSYLSQNSIEAV